jgi:putative protease
MKNGLQLETAGDLRVAVLTERRDSLPVILSGARVAAVYLDFAAYGRTGLTELLAADAASCRAAGKAVYFALPRVFREKTAEYFEGIAQELGAIAFDGFLVRTYEEISYVRKHFSDCEMVIDHNLYTYNDHAIAAFAGIGAVRNTMPLELNRGEIKSRDNCASEMIVYGYYPLMTSAQCVHGNTAGCDRLPGICYLKDRYKVQFPVKNVCSACYNVIYNSRPTMLFAQMKDLQKAGIRAFRLEFTVEEPEQVQKVLQFFDDFAVGKVSRYPEDWHDRYTTGHYKRGVE